MLVGREAEAARLLSLLAGEPVVVLAGPLGVGKTELARAVAQRHRPRPVWVSIAGANGERELLERTARAMGHAPPAPDEGRVLPALVRLLEKDPCTLVWDDAQDAAIAPLIAAAEALRKLAESRLLIVAREAPPGLIAPCFTLGPLDPAACRELIAAVEAQRGRSVQEELALRSGGNPLALQLALAGGPADAVQSVRLAAAALSQQARRLLDVLLAADAPLHAHDLDAGAVAELSRQALLTRDEQSAALPAAVRAALGEPGPAAFHELWTLAQRALSRSPGDPDALLLACRALSRRGEARQALHLLRKHAVARAAAPSARLEAAFGEIAAADPSCAAECYVALAREQLRWGRFDAAKRALDQALALELPPALLHRARVLRAEALVREGSPSAAAQELQRARSEASPGAEMAIDLGLAELGILRGELTASRRALLLLAARTRAVPALEGRRATALALSYLFEERHAQALAWVRRAQLSHARRQGVQDPLAVIVEVAALLGLDRIDRALAAATRDASGGGRGFGRGPAILFHAGVLFRRGELAAALEISEPAYRGLDRSSDRIFRAIVALHSCRCALGLGQLARAEEFLRVASGIAGEPGLAVLRPGCDMEFALLLEARGEAAEAREQARRALEGPVRSAIAAIEAWALGAAEPPQRASAAPGLFALRGAERALADGQLEAACRRADEAARFYQRAGADYELSRALLAQAEALARLRLPADEVLQRAEALASKGAYLPVRIGLALVRAAIADGEGRYTEYQNALAAALGLATPELRDAALLKACARAGIAPDLTPAAAAPFRARVSRLGLDRPAPLLAACGDRRWLLEEHEEPSGFVLLLRDGEVRSQTASAELPPLRAQLLDCLARAGHEGATQEQIHRALHGGRAFHPLRNRNAVYVAIARLREVLADLVPGESVVEPTEGRYRLVPATVVVCRAPKAAQAQRNPAARPGSGQTK